MNVFIYLRAVLRIKLGPVIAPDRHSDCLLVNSDFLTAGLSLRRPA